MPKKRRLEKQIRAMKCMSKKLCNQGIFIPCLILADFDIEDLKYISENSKRLIPELEDGACVKVLGFNRKDDYVYRIVC